MVLNLPIRRCSSYQHHRVLSSSTASSSWMYYCPYHVHSFTIPLTNDRPTNDCRRRPWSDGESRDREDPYGPTALVVTYRVVHHTKRRKWHELLTAVSRKERHPVPRNTCLGLVQKQKKRMGKKKDGLQLCIVPDTGHPALRQPARCPA